MPADDSEWKSNSPHPRSVKSNSSAGFMFAKECHAMKKLVLLAVVVVAHILAQFTAFSHPRAGIVVDQSGNVFAAGSLGSGPQFPGFVWKIDAQGQVTRFQKISAHWLALDAKGRFDRAKLEASFRVRKTPWLGPIAMPDSK